MNPPIFTKNEIQFNLLFLIFFTIIASLRIFQTIFLNSYIFNASYILLSLFEIIILWLLSFSIIKLRLRKNQPIILTFLLLHCIFVIMQATIFPELKFFIAEFFNFTVAANLETYSYRSFGLVNSFDSASVLCVMLLFFSLYDQKRSPSLRVLYGLVALIAVIFTARTGLFIAAIILLMYFFSRYKFLASIIMISTIPFLLELDFSSLDQTFGIIYQLAWINSDLYKHFLLAISPNLTLDQFIIGTGNKNVWLGDAGTSKAISQHGLLASLALCLPYIYLLKNTKIDLKIPLIIFLLLIQFKADFLFSAFYMFLILNFMVYFSDLNIKSSNELK